MNKRSKGWYEYSNFFINVLIALDDSNKKMELSKSQKNIMVIS